MKILVIRFSALGDVAMVAPVLKEFALANPDVDITMLSQPFCAPLFNDLAPNVHFLGKDVKKAYRGVFGIYRLFRELHAMHFDRVCDLHDVLRTKLLRFYFRLHGYSISCIDKMRADRKLITAPEGQKQLKQLKTSFEKYREALTTPTPPTPPDLPKGEGKIDTFCGSTSLPFGEVRRGSGFFGIAPFAAHAGKIYPLEKMERVIQLLIERDPDCRIVLFGGKGKELEQMLEWKARYANVSVASEMVKGLGSELELMKQLDCMISMDSANMHLASLVGTRVISVWGATHPYAGFLGWGQRMEDCVQVDLPCRPCSIYGNKPCRRGDFPCMNNITPEMIVGKRRPSPTPHAPTQAPPP